jgi:hypothetical protein
MKFERTSEAALYLWDYFYVSRYPTKGEAKAWRRIECATFRIRESETWLDARHPAPVRYKNARRVRRAVREVKRLVGQLESTVEPWVMEVVLHFESLAESVVAASQAEAEERPLH